MTAAMRICCRALVRRNLDLRIEGLANLPTSGPALLVCRHYHHLYDGAILLAILPRFVHILVALDWAPSRPVRLGMELACHLARWPVVLRRERLMVGGRGAFQPHESRPYLRQALREAVALLQAGEILVVFPEAYPNVDPVYTPKESAAAFLPFRVGFAQVVESAQRDGRTRVAIVPTGLRYEQGEPPRVTVRFGPPRYYQGRRGRDDLMRAVEEDVRRLSNPS